MAIPKQSKPVKRVPRKTRRLQPGDFGYSPTAKRRVAASIKPGKVTEATPTYSDRAIATAKLRSRLGKRTITKEAYTAVKTVHAKNGRTQYNDLSHAQLMRILKANNDKNVNLSFRIRVKGRALGSGAVSKDGFGWRSASAAIEAGELRHNFSKMLAVEGASDAIRYSVIV